MASLEWERGGIPSTGGRRSGGGWGGQLGNSAEGSLVRGRGTVRREGGGALR